MGAVQSHYHIDYKIRLKDIVTIRLFPKTSDCNVDYITLCSVPLYISAAFHQVTAKEKRRKGEKVNRATLAFTIYIYIYFTCTKYSLYRIKICAIARSKNVYRTDRMNRQVKSSYCSVFCMLGPSLGLHLHYTCSQAYEHTPPILHLHT